MCDMNGETDRRTQVPSIKLNVKKICKDCPHYFFNFKIAFSRKNMLLTYVMSLYGFSINQQAS